MPARQMRLCHVLGDADSRSPARRCPARPSLVRPGRSGARLGWRRTASRPGFGDAQRGETGASRHRLLRLRAARGGSPPRARTSLVTVHRICGPGPAKRPARGGVHGTLPYRRSIHLDRPLPAPPRANWSTMALPVCQRRRRPVQTILPLCSIAASSPMRRALANVVGDGDRGRPRRFNHIDDQPVDHRPHDGVEARGRLVEEMMSGSPRSPGRGRRASACRRQFGGGEIAPPRRRGDWGEHLGGLVARGPAGDALLGEHLKQTFSQTGRLSNSAPFWNSMPMRSFSASRSRRGMARMSRPSISMVPASGAISPRMHLMVTDLPDPDPPRMTMPWPARMSRSTPSSTCFAPKDLLRPRRRIFGTGPVHRAKNISVSA